MTFREGGKIYRIDNLVINNGDISAVFYHPDYGYVTVTTPAAFTLVTNDPFSAADDQYCGGSLQISGAGGVIDFTADATCSTYDICFTPTGGTQTCQNGQPWPQ